MKKQKQRLMKPADGEGGDLGGGGATAAAIDAMGTAPESQAQELPTEAPANAQAQPEAQPTESVAEQPARGKSKMEAMLDALTDDPNTSAKPAAEPNKAAPPKATDQPKAPEQEVAELLDGVKSERGRERIKQAFAEKKQLEQEIGSFREMVRSTGMSPQQFAQTLEFGRLVSSGDEKNIRMALEMIEGQRAALYQKLGVEAPGVDLLQGHDDLKQAVDGMEITRQKAVELAKYRKQQQEAQQHQQAQQQTVQQQHEYQQQVQQATQSMDAYLQTRANEVDHPARIKLITDHFKNPENLQKFVSTYQPHQWADTVRLMYDGIHIPRQASAQQQPIRSRPSTLGAPAANGASAIDRIAQRMESMGL